MVRDDDHSIADAAPVEHADASAAPGIAPSPAAPAVSVAPARVPLARRPIVWVALLLAIGAAIGGWLYWRAASRFVSTDDAYIDAHIVRIAPQVAGTLTSVAARDNAHVQPGDLLATIDPAGPEAQLAAVEATLARAEGALAQAEAEREQRAAAVEAARSSRTQSQANLGVPEADLARARRDLARYVALQRANPDAVAATTIDLQRAQVQQAEAQIAANRAATGGAGENITVAQRQLAAADAGVRAARAEVRGAGAQVRAQRVSFGYLRLVAPVAGHVTNRTVNVGSYVGPGTQMMAIVPDEIWITANFKETQLKDMRTGQRVDIKVDALPGVAFTGHVDSFQRGAGQAFQLLPAQNATGNFVKVVQRVPVRIVFDRPSPADYPIGPGMSVTPKVRVRG